MTIKVVFQLERNEDGYPPIAVEMLNAKALGGGLFLIQNTPFFTENVSYHDVVKASATDVQGQQSFDELVEQSDFTALSIIILDESMDTFLMDLLRGLSCVIEYGEFSVYRVLAVAVPATTDYATLRGVLQSLEDRELISFSELAVG
ncbi:MAG: DUF4265 domain-containing protein [Arenimonas sp.]|nr:DUF4265 domain-containing protein [Arenimonas sp.]